MTTDMYPLRRLAALAAAASVMTCASVLGSAPTEGQNAPPANVAPTAPTTAPAIPPAKNDTKPEAKAPRTDLPAGKDIYAASVKAMGGQDAIDRITSMSVKATGTGPMPGELKLEIRTARPDKVWFKQSMTDQGESVFGMNGSVGWLNSPMSNGYALLGEQQMAMFSEQMRQQIDFHAMVFGLGRQFPAMDSIDRLPFDTEDCYKLRLSGNTPDDGIEHFAYFSADKGLLRAMELVLKPSMGDMSITIKFQEWQPRGELTVFTKVVIDQPGSKTTMNYDEVEFNKVDPASFEVPAEVVELIKKKNAAGANSPEGSKPAPEPSPSSKPAPPEPSKAPGNGGSTKP